MLSGFVDQQLADPGHPKTLIYHFTRPNPSERPLKIEFTEVYLDDKVFWNHLDASKDPQLGAKVMDMFSEKTRAWRRWNFYGQRDCNVEKTKHLVVDYMGANADGKIVAGFTVNDNVGKGNQSTKSGC